MLSKRILAAATMLACSLTVQADGFKFGYVNIERLYREAAPAVAAQKKLEQEFGARDAELRKLAGRAQELQKSLEKGKLADVDRRTKERELAALDREFQSKQRELREDFTVRRNEEFAAVLEQANSAVLDIAKKEGYDLILQEAVYAKPQYDLTERILKVLDR